MKKFIAVSLLVLSFSTLANRLVDFEGTIQSATIGEFDPFVVGDSCLVEVRLEKNRLVGLVTDFDLCLENESELKVGRCLSVVVEARNQIKQHDVLSILKRVSRASQYYEVSFGHIENGLCDE